MKAIKQILKGIFPIPFLKKLFLIYNKIRIASIDKFLFPEYSLKKEAFVLFRIGYPFVENKIDTMSVWDSSVKQYMNNWYNWKQEEFLLRLSVPCYIEPDYGWAIVPPNRLVYYSLGISRTPFQRKPHFIRFLYRKNVIEVENAISLRDTGEENYFHFFNDVISKIFFLRKEGVDVTSIPVIISGKLWSKPYFQYYYDHSDLFSSLRWIKQNDEYVFCRSVFFCKPITHRADLWASLMTPFTHLPGSGSSRIFITRSRKRLRFLENHDQVEKLFKENGFSIIDADNLSINEQIDIFNNAGFIAGIHGAGLTNMVLRKGSCKIFEIFPPPESGYLPFHYIMLARMKNFEYQAVIGNNGKAFSGGFYIKPEKIMQQLSQMLE